jgi:hypothetical protein
MKRLREAMESIEMDVFMSTDGKISDRNWAELENYKEAA